MHVRRATSMAVILTVAAIETTWLTGCGRQEPGAPDDASVSNSDDSKSALTLFENKEPEAVSSSGDATSAGKVLHENRLANETSPYLLMHAHNPVDWYAWGPEAFEAAKKLDKPIFLSIGYSSCYWCHVMERLVFENEEIAAYMNEHFINVKVDREERPDVDDIYMTALQIYLQLSGSGGGGGWPLSMFLTPEGKPIAGGTYFPPDDIDGRTGFPTIARSINDVWTTKRDQIEEGAETITSYLRQEMLPGPALEEVELNRGLAELVTTTTVQSHDAEFGGFDFRIETPDAPKFPVPTRLALLQYEARERKNAAAERTLYHTLDAMAAGGIRDHLAGGFHRYSTDRQWLVPHFEKMLYDNAQLADIYVEAYRATNNPTYREVADEILSFILKDMTDPVGGFHSAIDAETEGIEGKYYVWSLDEVRSTLGDQAIYFTKAYGMDRESPFEHGYVLNLPRSIEEVAADNKIPPRILKLQLEEGRDKLLTAREQRESPLKDDKILASWNGLMIRAFANAGAVFSRKQYLDAAEKSLMFILTNMRDSDGQLLRTWRADTAKYGAYLDDYAFVIESMLTLHLITREDKWLIAARRLTDDQLSMFYDEEAGGFYFTSHGHEQLLARTKNAWDSVLPSGNSVSVRNLIRLSSLTGDPTYRERAQETLETFAPQMHKNPRGASNMALALHEFLDDRDYRPLTTRIRQNQLAGEASATQQIGGNSSALPSGTIPGEATESPARSGLPTGTPPRGLAMTSGAGQATPQASITSQGDAASSEKKKTNDRVTATAFLSASRLPAGNRCQIAVVLDVAPGWHINTNPASPEFLIPTTVSIRSSQGTTLESLVFPSGKPLQVEGLPEPYQVYDGRVTVFGELVVPAAAAGKKEEFELHIRYQACDDEHCERPRTLKFAGTVPVSEIGETVEPINQAVFRKKRD